MVTCQKWIFLRSKDAVGGEATDKKLYLAAIEPTLWYIFFATYLYNLDCVMSARSVVSLLICITLFPTVICIKCLYDIGFSQM